MDNRSSKAVADFFATMLDEKGVMEELQQQPLERLLAQVTTVDVDQELSSEVIDPALLLDKHQEKEVIAEELIELPLKQVVVNPVAKVKILQDAVLPETSLKTEVLTKAEHCGTKLKQEMAESFPVLYFAVGEYTFAVPLIKLKAIYRLKEPTKIFGKPNWFSGIQVEREQKLGIVDTACYLMPEKFNRPLEHSLNYKYIIVLGDSNWGLKCDALVDSENLSQDEIKWRTKGNSSPWLAGTVKQRMCGLLAVDELIELLEKNTSV